MEVERGEADDKEGSVSSIFTTGLDEASWALRVRSRSLRAASCSRSC